VKRIFCWLVPAYIIETFKRTTHVKWALLALCVCMVGVSSSKASVGYIAKMLTGSVKDQEWDRLILYGLYASGLIMLMLAGDILKEFLAAYVRYSAEIRMRNEAYQHLMNMSMSYFDTRRTGELLSRLTNDLHMAVTLVKSTVDFASDSLSVIALMLAALTQGVVFGVVVLVAVVGFVLTLRHATRRLKSQTKSRQKKLADVLQQVHETFAGVTTVKAFEAEERESAAFQSQNREFFERSLRVVKTKVRGKAVSVVIVTAAFLSVILIAWAYLRMGGTLDVAKIGMIATIVFMLRSPCQSVAESFNALREAGGSAERFFELMAVPIPNEEGKLAEMPPLTTAIEIKDVEFAYGAKPVLQGISLRIEKGKKVALVGPTGAGKSTLLDLIARFYEPQAGEILFDGRDYRQFTRRAVLSKMAIVSQEPFLFNTTIEANIKYGKPDATMEEVEAAARAAHIHDSIMRLPDRYQTVVGERGDNLSGGERQRVTIARALLKNPEILLLDEATASLDPESEKLVAQALERLMEGRTTILIAHKIATVQDADLIVVIERGRIVQMGRHEELIAQDGLYRKLFNNELRA